MLSEKELVFGAAVLAGVLACARPAAAVIVLGGSGNDYVSATSHVPDSINGYPLDEYVGGFFGFLGTPISSRYFVTANHITGATTGTFTYANGTATPINYTVDLAGVDNDLAVWEIDPSDTTSFSLYAPLYTSSGEIGQPLVVLGNGTSRAAAVTGGFAEGAATGQTSYGTNTVIATPTAGVNGFTTPTGFGGDFLQYAFENNGNPDEAILSGGDSGGPVFVENSAGDYQLAGVTRLVDDVDDANGNALAYALYDDTGYYYKDASGTVHQIPTADVPAGPLSSYATRISSRLDFIDSVTGIPEPTLGLALIGLLPLTRRRRSV